MIFDRVLTDTELAYYDTAMREYEKATSAHGLTFAAATGGRATIALPEPGGLLGLASGGFALLLLDRFRGSGRTAREGRIDVHARGREVSR